MLMRRGTKHLVMVIVAAVMPSVLSLTYYYFSRDPTVRPLGITQQSLRAYTGKWQANEIVAIVTRGGQTNAPSFAQIARDLTNGFAAKGVDVHIELRQGDKEGTWITYRIGPSVIGPYSHSRAVEGVNAAVAVYRMAVPYKP